MGELICIDLSKYNRIEIAQIAENAGLDSVINVLHEMKINGYARVYIEPKSGKLFYYTLSSSKANILISEYVKGMLSVSKERTMKIGYSIHELCGRSSSNDEDANHRVEYIHLLSTVLENNYSPEDYESEIDRILDEINTKSIDGLTFSEKIFLKNIGD